MKHGWWLLGVIFKGIERSRSLYEKLEYTVCRINEGFNLKMSGQCTEFLRA